jgi:type I restriction enzyme S subunit
VKPGWTEVALGEVCDIQIGKTPPRRRADYWNGDLPWLSISDMSQGRQLTTTSECITSQAAKELNCRLVSPGTVLLSFKLSIGKVGIASVPMYTNEAIAHLPISVDHLDPTYLFWVLRTVPLTDGADRAAMGSTLNKSKLANIRFPLPPLEEQKRIAAILDKADELQAKRRAAVAHLDLLTQAVFAETFGDPFLGPHQRQLGDFLRNTSSLDPSKTPEEEFSLLSIPAFDLGSAEQTVGSSIGSPKQIIEVGDVLLSKIVPHIRRVWVVESAIPGRRMVGSSEWIVFNSPEVDQRWLRAALSSPSFAPRFMSTVAGVGGSLLRARPKEVARIGISVPELTDQIRFSGLVRGIESERDVFNKSLSELADCLGALQHRAFVGDL